MAYDFSELDTGITSAKEWLQTEFQGIRTGRATPNLLDGVYATAYGSRMKLNQLANVGTEDARTLRVAPFDMSLVKDIEKALTEADLGVGISADSNGIRVTFPELTSERRTQLMKLAKDKLEQARISIRQARDEAWSAIQSEEREGEMTEDDKFKLKEQMEKKVSEGNDALDTLFKKKETEISQ